MDLQNVSIVLNIILAAISIYLFFNRRNLSKLEAKKNYDRLRIEIHNLYVKNRDEYKKKAVEMGASLDKDGEFHERSFRSVHYLAKKELESFSEEQENEVEKLRTDLRYWAGVGSIDLFSHRPRTFKEKLLLMLAVTKKKISRLRNKSS